jgi:hypothetical protein
MHTSDSQASLAAQLPRSPRALFAVEGIVCRTAQRIAPGVLVAIGANGLLVPAIQGGAPHVGHALEPLSANSDCRLHPRTGQLTALSDEQAHLRAVRDLVRAAVRVYAASQEALPDAILAPLRELIAMEGGALR